MPKMSVILIALEVLGAVIVVTLLTVKARAYLKRKQQEKANQGRPS